MNDAQKSLPMAVLLTRIAFPNLRPLAFSVADSKAASTAALLRGFLSAKIWPFAGVRTASSVSWGISRPVDRE